MVIYLMFSGKDIPSICYSHVFTTSTDTTKIKPEKFAVTIEHMDHEFPSIGSWLPKQLFISIVGIYIIGNYEGGFPSSTKIHGSGNI